MKKILIILVIAVVFSVGVYAVRSYQLSKEEIFSEADDLAKGDLVTKAVASPMNERNRDSRSATFDYEQLVRVIKFLNDEQRQAVLADRELFARVVDREVLRLSLMNAANADSQLENDERFQFLRQRRTEDFLINGYIQRWLQTVAPPNELPSEQQIQQFYEKNKQRYTLAERMPVWQIFWRVTDDASNPVIAKLLKKASLLSSQIRKGDITFAQAALAHSQHVESRLQGGYMGMLLTSDLLPSIKDKLLALKKAAVSQPIRSEDGVHLIRRGEIQPAEILRLSQVREQVVKELVQVLRRQQRAQLNRLVRSRYPVQYSASQLDDWMRRANDGYRH